MLQYSCLENSMNRGAWQARVHEVAKSQTRVSTLYHHYHHFGVQRSISQDSSWYLNSPTLSITASLVAQW